MWYKNFDRVFIVRVHAFDGQTDVQTDFDSKTASVQLQSHGKNVVWSRMKVTTQKWAWPYLRRAAYRLADIDLNNEGGGRDRQRAPVRRLFPAVNHPRSFQPITLKSLAEVCGCEIDDPPPAVIQLTDPLTVSVCRVKVWWGKRTELVKLIFFTAHRQYYVITYLKRLPVC